MNPIDVDADDMLAGFVNSTNSLGNDDDLTIVRVNDPNQVVIEPEEKKRQNDSKQFLRQCYTNEVKYARELKIHLKGPKPAFYPNIPYNQSHILNLRKKRPRLANREYDIDESSNMWILNHANRFSTLGKWVGKIYWVHFREKDKYHSKHDDTLTKLTDSGDGSDFRIIAATCFITKLFKRKVVLSPLHWFMRPEDFPLGDTGKDKPLTYASFDQKDYISELRSQWNALKHSRQLTRDKVQEYMENSELTKIKIMKDCIRARRNWLKTNFKSSELLDSEFYDQIFPSVDIAFSDISPDYLKK
jgi:hypothetical protein